MTFLIPRTQAASPFGTGFVFNTATGKYDANVITPTSLSGAILGTDSILIARNLGTDAAPSWTPFYATPAQVQALGGGSASSSSTTTGTMSSNSTVAADGTLSGLPSTIVAGQPLSTATFTAQSSLYLVLYRVSGGVEEGSRWASSVMPGGTLSLLIPQTTGAYTVRGFTAVTGGSATYESASFTVTAAPGALPATPTQTADTGATATGVVMNWTSTATSYHVLTRAGVGAAYGSLNDQAQWPTNSFSFQNLDGNSSPRAVVIPQNANGAGTPSGQFLSAVQSSVAATAASALVGVPSSITAGTTIGGTYSYDPYQISTNLTPSGALAWAVRYNNGAEVGSRAPLVGSMLPEFLISATAASGSTLRIYSAKTGGTMLQESAPITVTAN